MSDSDWKDSPQKKKRKKSQTEFNNRSCIIHIRNDAVESVSKFTSKSWEVIFTLLVY